MSEDGEGADRVGRTLASKYHLESVIGQGGMGTVYKAKNVVIGRPVAIKVLHSNFAESRDIRERFLREARAANLVRHPNVVDVLDVGEDRGEPFIVQELLEGEDFASYVTRRGALRWEVALDIILPIVEAVEYAHARGVVHRDLKPENVYLAREGGKVVPKLLDFGVSHIASLKPGGERRLTHAGSMMGTPLYMAPEQVRGTGVANPRSDVWALGMILYEVIAGRVPFEADTTAWLFVEIATVDLPPLASKVPTVPRQLSRIVSRCLRRDSSQRYANAGELAKELRDLRASEHEAKGAAPRERARASVPERERPETSEPPGERESAPAPVAAPSQGARARAAAPAVGGPAVPDLDLGRSAAADAVREGTSRLDMEIPDLPGLAASTREAQAMADTHADRTPNPSPSLEIALAGASRAERNRSPTYAAEDRAGSPSVQKQPVASFVTDTAARASFPAPRRRNQYATPTGPEPLYDPTTFVAAVVMFAVALTTAGTMVRTIHRPDGWDLRLWIPPLAGSGVVPGVAALVFLGAGGQLVRGAVRASPRPKAILFIGSSCLVAGLALAAQAVGIVTSGTVMLLALGFVALGATGELSTRGMASWTSRRGSAIVAAALAGASFFAFVELVIGALQ